MRDLHSDDDMVHNAHDAVQDNALLTVKFIEVNLLEGILCHTVLSYDSEEVIPM